ncbi:MAG: sialate O-acetylesterase, partial [Verrucomicrobia bacterium]|nr:sialate O-acetylesterase [Verrucomicrobiota bacterium]
TAHNLKWSLKLRALKAGGPDTLTLSTKTQTRQLTNVLVGEVWVCSGQSNMEFPLSRAFQPEADIATATNGLIRLFHVPKAKMDSPTIGIKASWQVCSPQAVPNFTAVGYYFGRDLQAARKVPVGLIQSDWGGSPAEAWMSREALEINPRYQAEILDSYSIAEKNSRKALVAYEIEKAEAAKNNQEFKKRAPGLGWKPSELYNGMIAPLIPYAIQGAIWYQGESNAGRAEQYRTLFPDMIRNWRRDWGRDDFPFLCVQLAPFKAIQEQPQESDWAELREAQLLATKVLPKVGMAVITDVGEENDIHPKKKAPVGARLALAARAMAYGEKITFSGPIYRDMKVESDKIILRFDHVGQGLEARAGELKGFALCGEDRKFVLAKAEILSNNTVAVSSPEVARPVAVRFGWANYPVVNLWNKDGLPASPFRTDDFPLTTAGKK